MKTKRQLWTKQQIASLSDYFRSTPSDSFDLASLSVTLGRTYAAVALKASRTGLANISRGKSTQACLSMSRERKARFRAHPERHTKPDWKKYLHPRGMLGKHHGSSARRAISAANRGRQRTVEQIRKQITTTLQRYGRLAPLTRRGTWRAEWVTIGGKRFFSRSSWEAIYATHLQDLKERSIIADWHYEPDRFWVNQQWNYVPDFRIDGLSGEREYHEVKGWMDARSKRKIKAFRKEYPSNRLIVRRARWFRGIALKCEKASGSLSELKSSD